MHVNEPYIMTDGCRGRDRHQEIVDWLRFDLPPILRELALGVYVGPEVTYHDNSNGGQIPDGMLIFNDAPLVLEVGDCQVGKWPDYAVLHIGFDGTVNVVNPEKCSATYAVRDVVSESMSVTLNAEAIE